MLKNYLTIGWRNLMKDKTFTFLNVLGLSVAFGVAILLSMAAFFDLSYDKFHANADNIHRIYSSEQTAKGKDASVSHPAPLAEALKAEVPGVERISRHVQDDALTIYGDTELNLDAVWVDKDFFAMFSFPALKGNMDNPLENQSSIVITESTADKLFGEGEAIGQTVNILISGEEQPFIVSSVVADNPPQSTLEFDLAIRFEKHYEYSGNRESWDNRYHDIYVQLQNGVSPEQFEKSSRPLIALRYQEQIENAKRDGARANADGLYWQIGLLSMTDVHFASFPNGFLKISRMEPYLILGIAFLILFIACVNFINMSIAKSTQRLREIGMRKTLGAQKPQLFFQFCSESFFVFMASAGIGIALSILLLDDFKTIFRTDVSLEMVASPWAISGFLGVVLLITLIVGGYPALLMSKLGTIQSLKGKLDASGKNRVRDVLMVVQFSIAILLISGTLILWSQLDFMLNKNLGFNKEQVISFPLDGKKNSYEAVKLLRDELRGNPDVLNVTAADNNLGYGLDGSSSKSLYGYEYKGRSVGTNFLTVDYDYVETLGLQMVAGRNFQRGFANDSLSVVINEAMARELGEDDPLTAYVMMNDSIQYPVIGVVKDYNFERLDKAIEPLTMFINSNWDLYYAYVKVAPRDMVKTMDALQQAWVRIEPNAEFLGSFLDENVDRTFRREKVMTTLITSGSVIAIVLSCIGLFAISLLVVNQRTKEIGIRKVIGASVSSITFMLTKDFLKLVIIAFLIASPIAWWSMNEWLKGYAFRIELNVWFFIGAGMLAMVIAFLTVGTRTVKAALQNPVKSLRTE